MCITYKSSHPELSRACEAQSSMHDVYWAVACNVNVNANKKPIMFCPNMFGSFGAEEGRGYGTSSRGREVRSQLLKSSPVPSLGCLALSRARVSGDNLRSSIDSLMTLKCHFPSHEVVSSGLKIEMDDILSLKSAPLLSGWATSVRSYSFGVFNLRDIALAPIT